jgi:hypothetical protein
MSLHFHNLGSINNVWDLQSKLHNNTFEGGCSVNHHYIQEAQMQSSVHVPAFPES